MKAVALARFGGPEELVVREVPRPEVGPTEVMIRVQWSGVAEWDVFEREGGFAELLGQEAPFPRVLGSEGAGTVEAVGEQVEAFRPGDAVYASGFLNPKGGFHAEYAVVDASVVSRIPRGMPPVQAGGLAGVGITALRASGVEPAPQATPGTQLLPFNGDPDHEVLTRLNRWVEMAPFELHVGATFPLEQVAAAYAAVQAHHLGKVMLQVQ